MMLLKFPQVMSKTLLLHSSPKNNKHLACRCALLSDTLCFQEAKPQSSVFQSYFDSLHTFLSIGQLCGIFMCQLLVKSCQIQILTVPFQLFRALKGTAAPRLKTTALEMLKTLGCGCSSLKYFPISGKSTKNQTKNSSLGKLLIKNYFRKYLFITGS